MKWYEGDIRQAVALSQSQKAVFFVGIFGTDGPSRDLEGALDSDEVQAVVASDEFVCLRLEADSEPHKQFAAIYANAKAPSIYCITDKGVPVEIIAPPISAGELKDRLESARNRHKGVLGTRIEGNVPATSSTQPAKSPADENAENNVVPDQPSSEPSSTSGSSQEISFEEKVRRAKELAQAKQLQKQKEEEEENRRREIERREAGKGMAELQRWQKEQEAKRIVEERKKEREEEKLLRQRLREQIAQDRAARNARSNVEFVEQAVTPTQRPTVTSNAPANFSGQARLQFRLPDGSSQTHAFSPDSTLGHVRQFLLDNQVVPFRNFSLWVAFPRRQFGSEEYGTTLRDLGLLPSAALLILPVSGLSNSGANNSGSNLWSLIAYLLGYFLYPVTFLWSVLQRALPAPSTGEPESSKTKAQPQPEGQGPSSTTMTGKGNKLGGRALSNDGNGDEPTNSTNGASSSSGDNPRKTKEKGGKNLSGPDGNVHRLRTKESDSDDEKATWNGNSTQQM